MSAVDHGAPPDALQLVVRDAAGRFRARVDMAWHLPDGVLLVEVDGREAHSRLEALVDDRRRQNRIATRQTTLLRFSGADAWDGTLGAEVAGFLRGAGWSPRPFDGAYRLPT
ncbi:hypothetical protein [Isoptericola sp. BMS4]|uniref:hypothetical protein n=1 Tax=Isoptericola sp. BMS4 TaxID=2527875 RepID=UPI0014246D2F|nr:hypothetical protein [Isoptericola sp. BMS4]